MSAASQPCPERELLLHGLADGELDAANALAMEEHLRGCEGCAAAFSEILRGKEILTSPRLRFSASASLQERVMSAIAAENGAGTEVRPARAASAPASTKQSSPRRFHFWQAGTAFSGLALAASLILFVSSWNQTPDLDNQLVSAHIRSMLVSHLTDVASSDQHTVKPWFLGKLDFAPPVVDLAQQGFLLDGGRLDYIGGRVVPALVYKHHGHVINIFVWPTAKMKAAAKTLDGYHVVSWSQGDFTFAAVSDLNLTELDEFQRAFRNAI